MPFPFDGCLPVTAAGRANSEKCPMTNDKCQTGAGGA